MLFHSHMECSIFLAILNFTEFTNEKKYFIYFDNAMLLNVRAVYTEHVIHIHRCV